MIAVSYSELLWLKSRGGRTTLDAHEDEEGKYVFMTNGRGEEVKVYIPKNYEQ